MPSNKKFLSISYMANSLIFTLSLVVIIKDVLFYQNDIYNSIGTLVGDENQISYGWYTVLILLTFLPLGAYLLKLNFSLISFEANHVVYDKYLGQLKPIFFSIEAIVRLLVYLFLLLLLAGLVDWVSYIVRFISPVPIIGYGLTFEKGSEYFVAYKGFPFLIKILSFNSFFFLLLMIWDLVVFLGNRFSENNLEWKSFRNRFFIHHFVGFLIWISLSFLLLSQVGHDIIKNAYAIVFTFLGLGIFFYVKSLIPTYSDLWSDVKLAYINEPEPSNS